MHDIRIALVVFLALVGAAAGLEYWIQRNADVQQRISHLRSETEALHVELEAAKAQRDTCMRDSELLERALDAASGDLRACDRWYAARNYAADADY